MKNLARFHRGKSFQANLGQFGEVVLQMVTMFSEMEHMGCRDHYILRCQCPTPNRTGNFLFENLCASSGSTWQKNTHVHRRLFHSLSQSHSKCWNAWGWRVQVGMVARVLQGQDDADKDSAWPCSGLLKQCICSKQMGIMSLWILHNIWIGNTNNIK